MSEDFQALPRDRPWRSMPGYRFSEVNLQKKSSEALGKVVDIGLFAICILLGLLFVFACASVVYHVAVAMAK
jgi:hypothetical protein